MQPNSDAADEIIQSAANPSLETSMEPTNDQEATVNRSDTTAAASTSCDADAKPNAAASLEDSDSEIEDVTDQYVTKKRAASPEIIEVEDVSSDEEEEDAKKMSSAQQHSDPHPHAARHKTQESDSDDDSSDGDISDCSSSSSDSSIEDVTEFMLAQKKEQFLQEMNGAIELADSDNDNNNNVGVKQSRKKKRRSCGGGSTTRKKRRKITQSPIEVLIDVKDIPSCPGQKCTDDTTTAASSSNEEPSQDEGDVDHTIKQRIVKLLNTGFHTESNENEAKNAMKLARRLMERYNLEQSVLLRERGDGSLNDFCTTNNGDNDTLGGGIVNVSLCSRKKGKTLSSIPRWLDFLVQPICSNFHVQAFKVLNKATKYREGVCTISFYGIRTNAQLAAYAFKIASERISFMSASYDPIGMSDVRNARLSYALGIVIGLDRDVTDELRKEEERRKAALKKARRAANSGDCDEEDEESSSNLDVGDDAENPIDLTLEKLESDNAAQLALVDHQKKIAEDVLKVSIIFVSLHINVYYISYLFVYLIKTMQKNNIKITASRKQKSINVDINAYEKGIVDSKAIDLNQQAIGNQ